MNGNMMIMVGVGLIGGSILVEIILGVVFKISEKKTISKIYEDIR